VTSCTRQWSAEFFFLGWTRVTGPDGVDRDYYVRQLRDWKFSVPIEHMVPAGMTVYARLCGWTLARAHARSGDRIALAAYLGGSAKFDQAIAGFAETKSWSRSGATMILGRSGTARTGREGCYLAVLTGCALSSHRGGQGSCPLPGGAEGPQVAQERRCARGVAARHGQ
jgi:hypothetical protein